MGHGFHLCVRVFPTTLRHLEERRAHGVSELPHQPDPLAVVIALQCDDDDRWVFIDYTVEPPLPSWAKTQAPAKRQFRRPSAWALVYIMILALSAAAALYGIGPQKSSSYLILLMALLVATLGGVAIWREFAAAARIGDSFATHRLAAAPPVSSFTSTK